MKRDDVRKALVERIKERRALEGASAIVLDIDQSIKNYPDLGPREKDFAFRYVMESKTYHQWAAFYNCHYGTIQRMMDNPRVKELMADIQFNFRKHIVGMQVFLVREAMLQYLRIFQAAEYPESLDAKRKTAKEILLWIGLSSGSEDNPRPVNVNILGEQRASLFQPTDSTVNVSIGDIERELKELRQLEEFREDAHKQSRNDNERKSNLKRIGGGFHESTPPAVEIGD